MNARIRLPYRRRQETIDLDHEGHVYSVSIGFDDADRVREVFVNGQKQGSMMDATLDDAAIVISHHLQRGGTADELRRSMSRLGGGLGAATEPASPIGCVIDLVASIEGEVAEAIQQKEAT